MIATLNVAVGAVYPKNNTNAATVIKNETEIVINLITVTKKKIMIKLITEVKRKIVIKK